jgi:hypothetical protein
MKHIFIYLFIHLFISCNKNNRISSELIIVKENSGKKVIEEKENTHLDTLSINQVLFNGEKMNIKYSDLKKKFRDSITYSEWACGHPFEWENDSVDFWSYHTKGLTYETNKEEALLISGGGENLDLTIKNRNVKLNRNTTLNDFKSIFYNSYKDYKFRKNKFPDDYEYSDYIHVAFELEYPEHHWIFYFDKKGFLKSFELYWWLC